MIGIPDKYIQINLPLTEDNYHTGNGEGVWVEVDKETRAAYDRDAAGKGYSGILSNDSLYYPGLKCGDVIPFEMRGEKRPVADFPHFLSALLRLTPEGKDALIGKIVEKCLEGGPGNVMLERADS